MVKRTPQAQRFHLMIDAFDCDTALLVDKVFLVDLIHKIAADIGMHILKGPIYADGIPENPGVSVFAIIDYSHISVHTYTDYREFSLDIFSCKPFDYKKAEDLVKSSFKITDQQISKLIVNSSMLE